MTGNPFERVWLCQAANSTVADLDEADFLPIADDPGSSCSPGTGEHYIFERERNKQ
jgi:hypothetical protein